MRSDPESNGCRPNAVIHCRGATRITKICELIQRSRPAYPLGARPPLWPPATPAIGEGRRFRRTKIICGQLRRAMARASALGQGHEAGPQARTFAEAPKQGGRRQARARSSSRASTTATSPPASLEAVKKSRRRQGFRYRGAVGHADTPDDTLRSRPRAGAHTLIGASRGRVAAPNPTRPLVDNVPPPPVYEETEAMVALPPAQRICRRRPR